MAVRRKLEIEVQTPSRITWTQLSAYARIALFSTRRLHKCIRYRTKNSPHRTLLHQKIAQMYQIQNRKFSAEVWIRMAAIILSSVAYLCDSFQPPTCLSRSKCTHRQVSESQSPGTTTVARGRKKESKVAKSSKVRALKSIEFGTPVARKKQETRPQQQRKTLEKKTEHKDRKN